MATTSDNNENAGADVRTINSSFPKIDNLEHFPLKVLLHIFEYVDDIGLLNLAIESCRFESIAKIVLNDRYRTKYFEVDDTKDVEVINDFFNRFGKQIRAINARTGKPIFNDHWMAFVLDKASNLRRLALDIYEVDSLDEQFLQQHVNLNITHLSIDLQTKSDKFTQFMAPDFRNLRLLAIGNYPIFTFESFKELIRNNPELKSLRIGEKSRRCCKRYTTVAYPFVEVMELIGTYVIKLKDFSYVNSPLEPFDAPISSIPDHIFESFVSALQHLESLTLTGDLFVDVEVLLHRLGLECTRIQHMELHIWKYGDNGSRIIDTIKLFENLKSLKLMEAYFLDPNMVESLVEHLPFLNDFQFDLGVDDLSVFLRMLKKCPSLENITVPYVAAQSKYVKDMRIFGEFIDEFIETVQQRKVKVQMESASSPIYSMSNNEIILKNNVIMHLAKPTDI